MGSSASIIYVFLFVPPSRKHMPSLSYGHRNRRSLQTKPLDTRDYAECAMTCENRAMNCGFQFQVRCREIGEGASCAHTPVGRVGNSTSGSETAGLRCVDSKASPFAEAAERIEDPGQGETMSKPRAWTLPLKLGAVSRVKCSGCLGTGAPGGHLSSVPPPFTPPSHSPAPGGAQRETVEPPVSARETA